MSRRRVILWSGLLGLGLGLAFLVGWWLIPDYEGELEKFDAVAKICDRNGEVLRVILDESELLCDPVPLAQMGAWTAKAVVAFEDKRFYEHGGVDSVAVCRAMLQNARRGRVVSGASTLSTLVVKLTEPRRRTPWTKVVEAHHAQQLEGRLSKDQIVEQYLNRAPFGGNVYGIEAASRRYFGKPARSLSLAESAMLVGLPQSPSLLRPDRHWESAIRQRNVVLARMLENGLVSRNEYEIAMEQPMTLRRDALPFLAPHFCDWIEQRFPLNGTLVTSLDCGMQRVAEEVLAQRVSELSGRGVCGGAVVILDVKSGELRAMVGSPDFWNLSASGQVNASVAKRSPGSTLKPFAYALAMDQGLMTPESMLADVPMHFAGYTPQNYSLDYRGPVSVRQALVQSLNIPALKCVEQVGLDRFVSELRQLGFSTLNHSAEHYGLGVVIGSCEATLLDLSNAYACLARGGSWQPLRLLKGAGVGDAHEIFSAESAFMVADMLGGDERSDELVGHVADAVLPRVAWKSGTSTGHRDAWTVAYNPDYVVGVWLGNPDGRGSDALIGGSAAAPVAGEIFRRLYPEGNSPWFEKPEGLKVRQVCARSGQLPCSECAATVSDFYIPRISSASRCPGTGIWPDEIQSFLEQQGLCESDAEERPLDIVSPVDGETYRLLPTASGLRQEIKLAADQAGSAALYWFVDDQLLRTAEAEQSIFWPLEKGAHTIACADAQGHSSRVQILVE